MRRLLCLSLIAVALTLSGATPVRAQGKNASAALRAALQARAGHYPLVEIILFPHDSALLVFEDSSYTGKAVVGRTWMFGPPVTEAEADRCPPEKVLGRQIARVFWRLGGKEADLKAVVVRVRGVSGLDRYSHTDMYYYPSQLEGRWAGDSEGRPLGETQVMKPTSTMWKVSAVPSVGSARNSLAIR